MIELIALFIAQFFNVFLLGLNSQFVRDRFILGAIIMSFNISAAQFIYTRFVSTTDDALYAFVFSSCGGALGISCSIVFYSWFDPKFKDWKEKRRLRGLYRG